MWLDAVTVCAIAVGLRNSWLYLSTGRPMMGGMVLGLMAVIFDRLN